MQIEYLADHMEFVPIIAQWHHSEWNETTLDLTAAELRTHTLRRQPLAANSASRAGAVH